MHRQFLSLLLLSSAVALVASGCGGINEGAQVTGSVTMGGQAQEAARVYFIPTDPKAETPPKGAVTDATGRFDVKLPPGKYAVTLTKMVDKDGNVPPDSEDPTADYTQLEASGLLRPAFPQQYASPSSTPLSVEIPPEGKDLEPFDVSR